MCPATHDMYVKLITSCLDYTNSNNCRNVLLRGLSSTSDVCTMLLSSVLYRSLHPSPFSKPILKTYQNHLKTLSDEPFTKHYCTNTRRKHSLYFLSLLIKL